MNSEVKILFTGDYCPIGRFESQILKSPKSVLGNFLDVINDCDFTFTNLEAPVTDSKQPILKTGPALKTNNESLLFLKDAGIMNVTLANNHIMDFGVKGLLDTMEALKKNEINYVGAGNNFQSASEPLIIEKHGGKFAILNFAENEWSTTSDNNHGASPINEIKNYNSIKNIKSKVDFVLIVTHGGHEMNRFPSPRMKELFRFYIDCGANAVINHHTHCTSGFEVYKNAPIFYSLGNFIFDHKSSRNQVWNKGMAVNLQFSNNKIDFELIHFNQANNEATLNICDNEEIIKRNEELTQINEIINNDEALEKEFQKWVTSQKKMFSSFIEPHTFKLISKLQSKKILPSLWRIRKKTLLLNLIRCEAHKDILVSILKDEISNT